MRFTFDRGLIFTTSTLINQLVSRKFETISKGPQRGNGQGIAMDEQD